MTASSFERTMARIFVDRQKRQLVIDDGRPVRVPLEDDLVDLLYYEMSLIREDRPRRPAVSLPRYIDDP